MRKYYQLVLFILSIVSLVCFLIYKHEYDRLRNVLEVLNVFGSIVTDGPQAITGNPEICHNGSLEYIPDFWHQYSDLEVYSAFKTVNEKGWSINTLAIVTGNLSLLFKQISCALISEDVSDDKFEGTIEWKRIETDNASMAYTIVCNVPEMIGNSYLLSLYNSKTPSEILNVPLHLGTAHLKEKATSLCIVSNNPYWHVGDLSDFIQYYTLLGADSFYLYHRGIGDQVISALKELTRSFNNITVHLTTWNLPSQSTSVPFLDFALISQDCAWRHEAKRGPSVTVQFGHFLSLPNGWGIKDFLSKTKGHSTEPSFEVRIPLQAICANSSEIEASPIRRARMINPKKQETRSGLLRWTEAPNHPSNPETATLGSTAVKLLTLEHCRTTTSRKKSDEQAVRNFQAVAQNIPRLRNYG
ncbi:uncharacterized protein LOC130686814 [Daphnia carinata]|uniref:uncharacterized protein LOC130686814 n=1 Tax=Daphnia carinata TaxID=120202 RepID=UPI00257C147F|nr:uncharacterized protein LOC130686814 [Daphnia carinata]